MNQQRKLSGLGSRTLGNKARPMSCETASMGSTKSFKSNYSNETNHYQTNLPKKTISFRKVTSGGSTRQSSQDSADSIHSSAGATHTTNTQATNNNNNNNVAKTTTTAALNVAEMLLHGVADNEILDIWLKSINCEDFLAKFIDSGYDMPTISRITPQDLTAIGVTDPNKRLKILAEIKKLNLQDGIPNFLPVNLKHWLGLLRLDSYYYNSLCDQKVDTIEKMCQLTWEDFEELGITKLGHQKRFQLAIERVKELKLEQAKSSSKLMSEPIYDTNPSQILLLAPTENHSVNGPVINKQSSTSELSSTGSGSMHSVYSSASTHYQPSSAVIPEQANDPMVISGQLPTPNSLSQHNQQQTIYSQPPAPMTNPGMIYQQPEPIIANSQNPLNQHSAPQAQVDHHLNQHQTPTYQSSGPIGFHQPLLADSIYGTMGGSHMTAPANGLQQMQNRQSMSQMLPFSALANLPKHQQLLLQQSSIYATLSRQPPRVKQPPPPVPIRTNSLTSSSLTCDDQQSASRMPPPTFQQHGSQQQHIYQATQPHQMLTNNVSNQTRPSGSSLFRSGTILSHHRSSNQFSLIMPQGVQQANGKATGPTAGPLTGGGASQASLTGGSGVQANNSSSSSSLLASPVTEPASGGPHHLLSSVSSSSTLHNGHSHNRNSDDISSSGSSGGGGSSSSQTLYNSASSGISNETPPNFFNAPSSATSANAEGATIASSTFVAAAGCVSANNGSGGSMHRSVSSSSTHASSCTLNDANLYLSPERSARNSRPLPVKSIAGGTGAMLATQPQSAATAAAQCNATTGKDDDFPPPPSPLSLTDSDEHDLVSLNSAPDSGNFSTPSHELAHGLMTFRVGI